MFISDTHLPQCMPAGAYHDPDWYRREIETVLRPSWHLVATTNQFKKEGSFVTRDLFGHPILLRKQDGAIHGFVNVCAHRLSRVESRSCGQSDVIRCPYHGWEYDGVTGDTRKIPDASSFRPIERGELGMCVVRVETCGSLVFVCLEEVGQSLREFLGDSWELLESRTGKQGAIASQTVGQCACNWKIAVENTLESYHIGFVHAKYFEDIPDEADCSHVIRPTWTYFEGPGNENKLFQSAQTFLLNRIGKKADVRYSHTHIHPTFTFARDAGITIFWIFTPVGVDRVELRTIVFYHRADSGYRRFWNLGLRLLARAQAYFWRLVVNQDIVLLPNVQLGNQSSLRPGNGLISRREERIPHFQKWILQQMGESVPVAAESVLRETKEGAV